MPRSRPWERISRSRPFELGGVSYQFSESIETKARLETRGPRFSLKKRFWGIRATATDLGDGFSPGTSVSPELIRVMGKTLNSNGWAFFVLQDGTTNDVTPTLPPEFNNYAFNVSYAVADLRIFFDGQDFTDAGPVAWIGQRIPLVCRLVPEIATITNYQWAIQGNILSNWIATSTSGKAYFANVFTNADITYYYWKPGTGLEARCLVKVEGVEVDAKTTFNVRAPDGGMTGQILNVVKVDNNYESFPNVALHFGDATAGIRFTRTVQGDCAWLQIATVLRRQKSSMDGTWERVSGTGLDGDFPYPIAGQAFQTSDSPGMPALPEADEMTTDDQFKMYLMFRPTGLAGNGAIYVPIARIGWSWRGHAILQNEQWSLVPNSSSASADPAPIGPPGFPEWELNISPMFLNFWQPE